MGSYDGPPNSQNLTGRSISILVVKTSSLGDIIQSFPILHYLHEKFPGLQVDWAVEASLSSIVEAHPLVHRTISLDLRGFRKSWNWKKLFREIAVLRERRYDYVFDLQKNTKSGFVTALTRSSMKVGFGLRTVREWPNVLATHRRFNISAAENMRLQYVGLLQTFFGDSGEIIGAVPFKLEAGEEEVIADVLRQPVLARPLKIMVCPGSRWINKQLPLETMGAFLTKVTEKLDAALVLVWGNGEELEYCERIRGQFSDRCLVLDKQRLPVWQNLMQNMDVVIAVDSAALHLCGTTNTPSFSIFGPTAPAIFKPMGARHFAMQGVCPYGRTFAKQCPVLRTCPTGACIRNLDADAIFHTFWDWWLMLYR